MIYLFVLILLILFTLHYDFNGIKPDISLKIFLWIVFVLLAGLRYRVGGDTLGYMDYFTGIPVLSDLTAEFFKKDEYQPLWVLFCSVCKTISKDFTFFQIVHAIIINSVVFRFINKNTTHFFGGILFYFIFYYLYFNMEILRESLAISVFLLSLDAFLSKKWLKYYFIIIFAFLFHLSAVVLFFLPFFRKVLNFRSYVILIVTILVVLLFFRDPVLSLILEIFSNERIQRVTLNYLRFKFNINGIIFTGFTKVILPLFIYYISEEIAGYRSRYKPLLYLYVIFSLISIFLTPFYRFSNYIIPIFYIFIMDLIFVLYKHKFFYRLRYLSVSLLFLLLFSLQIRFMTRDMSHLVDGTRYYRIWIPYHSVITKKTDEKREMLIPKLYGRKPVSTPQEK